jgi:hypothetical protein
MILSYYPILLRAERTIKWCTVHGAQTPLGPTKQLESILRSRRKLRLVLPGNAFRPGPVGVRSPLLQTGRVGHVCLHYSF